MNINRIQIWDVLLCQERREGTCLGNWKGGIKAGLTASVVVGFEVDAEGADADSVFRT